MDIINRSRALAISLGLHVFFIGLAIQIVYPGFGVGRTEDDLSLNFIQTEPIIDLSIYRAGRPKTGPVIKADVPGDKSQLFCMNPVPSPTPLAEFTDGPPLQRGQWCDGATMRPSTSSIRQGPNRPRSTTKVSDVLASSSPTARFREPLDDNATDEQKSVRALVTIAPDGRVMGVKVLAVTDRRLERTTRQLLAHRRFNVGTVERQEEIEVEFRLF